VLNDLDRRGRRGLGSGRERCDAEADPLRGAAGGVHPEREAEPLDQGLHVEVAR
jgi:hypothetical protein